MSKMSLSFVAIFITVMIMSTNVYAVDALVRNATIEMKDIEKQVPQDKVIKPKEQIPNPEKAANALKDKDIKEKKVIK